MQLSTAQKAALKADILANPALTQEVIDRRDDLIAAHYSAASSPAFIVWRFNVTRDECTVDGFDWTQVDNLTVGQARIWDLLFDTASRAINFGEPGKRAAISECWKGTAAKVAVATFVLGKGKRTANRVEKLFATGTGSDAAPGTLVVEGKLTQPEISELLNAA